MFRLCVVCIEEELQKFIAGPKTFTSPPVSHNSNNDGWPAGWLAGRLAGWLAGWPQKGEKSTPSSVCVFWNNFLGIDPLSRYSRSRSVIQMH